MAVHEHEHEHEPCSIVVGVRGGLAWVMRTKRHLHQSLWRGGWREVLWLRLLASLNALPVLQESAEEEGFGGDQNTVQQGRR